MRFSALVLAIVAFGSTANAFEYVLETKTIEPNERQALEVLFSKASATLPEKVKQALPDAIRVSLFDDGPREIVLPPKPGTNPAIKQKLGKSGGDRVAINRAFLGVLTQGEANAITYRWGERDLYRLALATLLHETVHVYDRIAKISSDDRFRQYAGFDGKRAIVDLSVGNAALLASPDNYEFKNPKEALAVNSEYFFLDPTYACRRPLLSRYLSEVYGVTPAHDCQVNDEMLVQRTSLSGDMKANWMRIDPARIYAIDYIVAGTGDSLMSRWGHSMFRIVLCSPTRTEMGAKCREDRAFHFVVSYRAAPTSVNFSGLSAATGKYPSKVYLLTMADVLDEYTSKDLREIRSYPLRLSRQEIRDFMTGLSDDMWTYQGRYYFLTNNCASEAIRLLSAAIGPTQAGGILTPNGLLKILAKDGRIDLDSNEIEVIPSRRAELENDFDRLNALGLVTQSSLDDYVANSSAEDRRASFEKFLSAHPGTAQADRLKLEVGLRFINLERFIYEQAQHDLQETALRSASPALKDETETLRQIGEQLEPRHFVQDGSYGIPLESETLKPSSETAAKFKAEVDSIRTGFTSSLASVYPQQTKELERSGSFISELIQTLTPPKN